MTAELEFFYDYVSGYSYLANRHLQSMGDTRIVYRPMFLGAVMKATGNSPPATLPAKRAWLARDVDRWAARYGVPFRFNTIFPQNTLKALRLAVFAQQENTFFDIHQKLFDAMFVSDEDLSDNATLARILGDAKLDVEKYLAATSSQTVKDRLTDNTNEAIERGAFGAPTFFVGDEMFFGNDRFTFIEEALSAAE